VQKESSNAGWISSAFSLQLSVLQPFLPHVLLSGYRPQVAAADVCRCRRPGPCRAHAAQRDRARPDRARLPVGRPARHRQDLPRPHLRQGPQLHRRPQGRLRSRRPRLCRHRRRAHLDVIEIDGASNNGVDQVRDLRDTVRYAPAQGKFKIYIIDEVHMLSTQAFNALLKTLEEPPAHVKFVFATTDPQKVLPTISRAASASTSSPSLRRSSSAACRRSPPRRKSP
jgi:hypothetical protein